MCLTRKRYLNFVTYLFFIIDWVGRRHALDVATFFRRLGKVEMPRFEIELLAIHGSY